MTKQFCGYISIVGKPNVGKSTLLNTILDKKISITSRKSQTTRNNIIGVKTDDEFQMIFLDTPGIHMQAKKNLKQSIKSFCFERYTRLRFSFISITSHFITGSGHAGFKKNSRKQSSSYLCSQ